MIWLIAQKTLLRNILDFRFLAASALVILLMSASGLLMGRELGERRRDDFQRRSSASSNLEQVQAVKAPSPLAFIADGGEGELPWTVTVKPEYVDTSRSELLDIEGFPEPAPKAESFKQSVVSSLSYFALLILFHGALMLLALLAVSRYDPR